MADKTKTLRKRLPRVEPRPGTRCGPKDLLADRYEIVRFIAAGGMGEVYEAHDTVLHTAIALKIIRGELANRDRMIDRFKREITLARSVTHPNVCRIFDIGFHGAGSEELVFLTMELVEGESLAARIEARGRMLADEARPLVEQMAEALDVAHTAGIVHRDFKCSNVLITTGGRAVVTDFGIAHRSGDAAITGTGDLIGTPLYMAPEQVIGGKVGPAADIYALGVVMFEMVTGELPFDNESSLTAAARRVTERAPRPSSKVADIDRRWDAAIARCLERDPADRFARAREVVAALDGRVPHRRRWLALPAIVALAVVGVAGVVLVTRDRDTNQPVRSRPTALVVASIVNETRDPDLDGLAGLLTTALDQSSRLSVISQGRTHDLLRELGRSPTDRIDEVIGRELCRAAGVQTLVVSTVRKFEDIYTIDVRVLDIERDEYVVALTERTPGKSALPALVDRVAARVRTGLGDLPAKNESVASLTTHDVEAYALYFEAERGLATGLDQAGAVQLLRKAVDRDPTFAQAWWLLAYAAEWENDSEPERAKAIAAAVAHVDRAPPRHGLLIRALDAHQRGDDDAAAALYERAIRDHEPDKLTFFLAGDLEFHRGRHAQALALFEKSLALDPTRLEPIHHATECLEVLGRHREMLALARTTPTTWRPVFEGRALAVAGELDAARRILSQPLVGSAEQARRSELILLEVFTGRLDRVDEIARGMAPQQYGHYQTTELVPLALDRGDLRGFAAGVRGAMSVPGIQAKFVGSWLRILAGNRRLWGWRDTPPPTLPEGVTVADTLTDYVRIFDALMFGDYVAAIAAARAHNAHAEVPVYERLAAGDLGGAIAELAPLCDRPVDPFIRRERLHVLAELSYRSGRYADALAALARMDAVYPNRVAAVSAYRGPTMYLAARCYEALGKHVAARAKYEALIAHCKSADADVPLLQDAKARLAALR